MAPKVYVIDGSPYCRAVRITAKAIGLKLDIQMVDFSTGEHLSPDFLKLNPQHSVPVLDDNGNVIVDSHAILPYLIGKYSKDDSLYPKDLYKRALVEQRLHFESGNLYPRLYVIDWAYMKQEIKSLTPKMTDDVKEAYGYLEKFLEGKQWVATDSVTIADLCIYPTIVSLDFHLRINSKDYPNITGWIKRMKGLPCLEGDDLQQKAFDDFFGGFRA